MELGEVVEVVQARRRIVEVPDELQAPVPAEADTEDDVATPRMS